MLKTKKARHYPISPKARALLAYMEKYYASRAAKNLQSKTHGWDHILPVAKLCVVLIKDTGGSKEEQELGFVAGLLHDACRVPESKEGAKIDRHELWGAQFAQRLLPQFGYSPREIQIVADAVASHSFSSTPRGKKKVAPSRGLVAWALKAADKKEQYEPWIIFRRGVFLGESFKKTPPFEKILAYWKSRMQNCEKFLRQIGGKMLAKSFPETIGKFAVLKEYFRRLSAEKEAEEALELEKEFKIIGAIGITRYCMAIGRRHGTKEAARKGYGKKLTALLKKTGKKKYSARQKRVLRDSLVLTKTLLKATPIAG